MILKIQLSLVDGTAQEPCHLTYAPHEKIEEGVDLLTLLPPPFRNAIGSVKVELTEDGNWFTVEAQGKKEVYSVDEPLTISLTFPAEGEASWHLDLTVLPWLIEAWDMLRVSHEGLTETIQREEITEPILLSSLRKLIGGGEMDWIQDYRVDKADDQSVTISKGDASITLDHSNPQAMIGQETFAIVEDSYILTEWDPFDELPKRFRVDARDLADSLEDGEAALRVAESIQEQDPEALEIIANYMTDAAERGSQEAKDWLADYYGKTDSQYDPYV